MKKRLLASVLLASMAFAIPVFADDDRTPDEYNPDAKYESPLDQPYTPVVNDYRKKQVEDENEAFARDAGLLIQREASGKAKTAHAREKDRVQAASSTEKRSAAGDNKAERQPEKDIISAEQRKAEQQAEKQAEKVLLETDEDFEAALDKDKGYPGHEYQARKQISSMTKANFPDSVLRPGQDSAEPALVKREPAPVPGGTTEAAKTGKEKGEDKKLPLVITGDDAQYANESGDFIIQGNVQLEQGLTRVFSTKAVGNAKTGDIWLLEGGTLEEPTNKVKSLWAHYNYNNETGELRHLKGASVPYPGSKKHDYYEAPHGIIEHGMMIIDQGGTTTRCPAVRNPSCLSVKAKTITIIPKDRIIARGVQVFVKGKHVYSRDVWINDLNEGKNKLMPRIGWKDDKGFYVSLDYDQPIGNPLLKNPTTFSMHQVYYTKSRYKPFYSLRHDERDFYVRLNDGYIYDSDDDRYDEGIWLHKKMDWGLFVKPHYIAKGLPVSVEANVTHGLWEYTNRDWSSWHTEKVIRLRHDRFYPLGGQKLYMDLMAGRKWVDESHAGTGGARKYGTNLHSNIYRGTLGYRFSDKWNTWLTYHNEHKTSYNFSLGQPSFAKEWRTGISWRPDIHNTFTIVNRHNSDSASRTHGNYSTTFSWTHRFCCEILYVSYTKKHYNGDHEWTVKFDFLNW